MKLNGVIGKIFRKLFSRVPAVKVVLESLTKLNDELPEVIDRAGEINEVLTGIYGYLARSTAELDVLRSTIGEDDRLGGTTQVSYRVNFGLSWYDFGIVDSNKIQQSVSQYVAELLQGNSKVKLAGVSDCKVTEEGEAGIGVLGFLPMKTGTCNAMLHFVVNN